MLPAPVLLLFVLAAFFAQMAVLLHTQRWTILVVLTGLGWQALYYFLLWAGFQFPSVESQQAFTRLAVALLMVGLALEPCDYQIQKGIARIYKRFHERKV